MPLCGRLCAFVRRMNQGRMTSVKGHPSNWLGQADFPGRRCEHFFRWVAQHLRYPVMAKKNGVSGRVMLEFTIMPDIVPRLPAICYFRSCIRYWHFSGLPRVLLRSHESLTQSLHLRSSVMRPRVSFTTMFIGSHPTMSQVR